MDVLISTIGLAKRDDALLHSLLRLLTNKHNYNFLRAVDPAAAQAIFVPGNWQPVVSPEIGQIVVRVEERQTGHIDATDSEDMVLDRPLGISQLSSILKKIGDRIVAAGSRSRVVAQSVSSVGPTLFEVLAASVLAPAKPQTFITLQGGSRIVVDAERNLVVGASRDQLLDAALGRQAAAVGDPVLNDQTCEAVDGTKGSYFLDCLLWEMSHRVGQIQGAGIQLLPGQCYRLTRWPDSNALALDHYPRIAALLSARAHTVDEVCAASPADRASVVDFIEAALVCGIATAHDRVAGIAANPIRTMPATGVRPLAPQLSLIAKLRQRLRLW